MTDPTIPTTEAGRKHVLNGWDHDEREQRRALVLAIEAEAAASALSALRAEVQHSIFGIGINEHALVRAAPRGVACLCGQYDDSDHGIEASLLWRSHLIESVRDHVLAAIDRIAKADPEGESPCPHGVQVGVACRKCGDHVG